MALEKPRRLDVSLPLLGFDRCSSYLGLVNIRPRAWFNVVGHVWTTSAARLLVHGAQSHSAELALLAIPSFASHCHK
jgi:hypothetical protein